MCFAWLLERYAGMLDWHRKICSRKIWNSRLIWIGMILKRSWGILCHGGLHEFRFGHAGRPGMDLDRWRDLPPLVTQVGGLIYLDA